MLTNAASWWLAWLRAKHAVCLKAASVGDAPHGSLTLLDSVPAIFCANAGQLDWPPSLDTLPYASPDKDSLDKHAILCALCVVPMLVFPLGLVWAG